MENRDIQALFRREREKLKVVRDRAPINQRSYTRWGQWNSDRVIGEDLTLEQIETIIRSGDLESLRQLSRYFYRTNSDYRNNIDFLASLPMYDTVVVPNFEAGKGSKAQIVKAFYNACDFVDKLDVRNTFYRVTKEWLIAGIYNGILRKSATGNRYTLQDLPIEYCRTRFKDLNNLNILEFNLLYFENITDETTRLEALLAFPEIIQKEWRKWKNHLRDDPWVAIPSVDGGVSFTFAGDQTPLLIASIPNLYKLKDAIGREEQRDENELYKLLIQKMPTDKNGELIFPLEEVAQIHASIADMLQDLDTVDVLTTFGDTSLENLQDSSAASQSADRIDKYRKTAWDALGRGEILFNPDGSSALSYMIKKDESLMRAYLNIYATWIKFHLNDKFSRTGLTFDFEILPTTAFNWSDLQTDYFRGAQYGYSKMFAGVASGIKQVDQISLMTFENDFLKMHEKMIPLMSSYTTSGNNSSGGGSSSTTVKTASTPKDPTNQGGRPELSDEQKSEKTQANIAAAG